MAAGRKIRFEVGGGLSRWHHGDAVFTPGEHEVPASDRELAKAVKDAAAAQIGIRILEGSKEA